MPDFPFTFRNPTARDAAAVWRLVRDAGTLEPNTPYAYLLICSHFSETSILASDEVGIAGFVASYRPPTHPEAVFVWQVGVHPRIRGRGLGNRMLHALLRLPACREVSFLEATMTPSNEASTKLFRSIARDFGVRWEETTGFSEDLFPGTGPRGRMPLPDRPPARAGRGSLTSEPRGRLRAQTPRTPRHPFPPLEVPRNEFSDRGSEILD